eukprot:4490037-Pyramimonas_sp.AAC.1
MLCSAAQIRRKEWSEWCADAMEQGARKAHSFVRGKQAPVDVSGPGPPGPALDRTSVANRMRAEKLKWTQAWKAEERPAPISVWPLPVPVRAATNADVLRSISKRFSKH